MSADTEATPTLHERVEDVIRRIRPFVQSDGGDLELVEVSEDGVAWIRLRGACVGCPSSQLTLKEGIEHNVRALVPEIQSVEEIQ